MANALVITVANSSPPPVGSVTGTDDDREFPVVLAYVPSPSPVTGAQVIALSDNVLGGGEGGGSPTGGAGGVLSGQYPNPGFAVNMATQAELDTHINDPTPHPVYDDLPSLTLLFQNGLI